MDSRQEELAFAYAMGLLETDEAPAFEKQITQDQALAALVDEWQRRIPALDNSVVPIKPPKSVWNKIKQEIWPKPKWDFAAWFRLSYIAAFASLVMVALVSVFLLQNPYQAKFGDEWMVKADIDQGMLTLVALSPSAVPKNKVCNLWIKDVHNHVKKVGVLPMKNQKIMDLKFDQDLYDMFKDKATLIISVDDKNTENTSEEAITYKVAWL